MPLTPAQRAVLDRIASGESHDYNTIFGGHKFSSFSDHPRIQVQIPGRPGLHSTAAGRYQMLASTWDEERARLGLKDFSPASQDAAAWDVAQRTYQQKTGRDLAADQTAGQVNWGVLAKQWPSLGGVGRAEKAPTPAFPALQNPPDLELLLHPPAGNLLAPRPRAAPEPTPAPPSALPSTLVQSLFPKQNFIPVDYNPFPLQPHLTPVEHDPFAQETSQ